MFRLFSVCMLAIGIGLTAQADEAPTSASAADKGAQKVSQKAADKGAQRISRKTADKGAQRVSRKTAGKGVQRVSRKNAGNGAQRVSHKTAPIRAPRGQKADRIVVYSATWCGPCRRLKPVLYSLKNEGYRVTYRDVDKDRNKLTYPYEALPTIYFVRGNEVIKKEVGYRSGKHIKANLRLAKKTNPVVVLLKNTRTAITTPIVLEGVVETFDLRRLSKEWNGAKKPRR